MTRMRPLLAVLATAGVALLLSSCGVESGDLATAQGSGTTTTTAPGTKLDQQQQAAVDALTDTYVKLGLEEKDARCLAEGIAESGKFGGSDVMDVVNECDIPLSDIAGIGQGAGTIEDGIKLGLSTSLEAAGLSEDDAACVADAYVDEYGSDPTAVQDRSKMVPLFESCGVDPSSVTFGN